MMRASATASPSSAAFLLRLLLLGTTAASLAAAFMAPQPARRSAVGGCRRDLGARGSTFSNGEFDPNAGTLFASSSSGFPSLGDGFPSIGNIGGGSPSGSAGAATADGFPSIGEISGISRPRRGVLIQNMPADSEYKIRILDREHKLGITAIVETIAIIKDTRFALCRTKDRAAAILDDFVFPVDVDSQQMAPLIQRANRILKKDGVELLWTAHTLTMRGLARPNTAYMSWKKPFNVQAAMEAAFRQTYAEGSASGVGSSDDDAAAGSSSSWGGADEMAMGDDFEASSSSSGPAAVSPMDDAELLAADLDRMDAAFFADVNDEDYANDGAEGLDKRAPLVEPEMLCEFELRKGKFRVVAYEEPVTVLAQWMEDGSWRLLKSVEAELVEDAIAYKGLQNVDVEMVEA